jgi:hypothetical protein
VLPPLHHHPAVDNDVVDADQELLGLLAGIGRLDGVGAEDDDVNSQ